MDYTIDNYRDMAIEYRTTAMNVLSNIMRKEKLVAESDLPQQYKNELKEEINSLRNSYNSLIDLEMIMIEKMEEKEMKMDLQKHIDEYGWLAESVKQTIDNKQRLLVTFSSDVTLARIFAGEIDIYQNILREIKATISLLEDMKGANPELLDNSELLEDKL